MPKFFKCMVPLVCTCAVFVLFGAFTLCANAQTTSGTVTQITVVKGTYTQAPESSEAKYSSKYAETSFSPYTRKTNGYLRKTSSSSKVNGGVKGVSFNASKNTLTLKKVKATTLNVSLYYSYSYDDTSSKYSPRTLYIKLVGASSLRALSIGTNCKVVLCGSGSLTLNCSKDLGENVYPKSSAALTSSATSAGNAGTFSLKSPIKILSGGSLHNNKLVGTNVRQSYVGSASSPSKKVLIGHKHKYESGICKLCGKTTSKSKISGVKLAGAGNGKIKLSWKKKASAKGYQISYKSGGKNWKKVNISSKSKSKVLQGLKSGKKASVKLRQYIKASGKKYYGAWSSTKTMKVK